MTGVSLFGGLCSQTLPPSNYVYIELSARLDASPAALGCLHGLSPTLVSSQGFSSSRCEGILIGLRHSATPTGGKGLNAYMGAACVVAKFLLEDGQYLCSVWLQELCGKEGRC